MLHGTLVLSVALSILSKRNVANIGTDQAGVLILCECIAASISVASRVCALECSGDKGCGYHCHSQEGTTHPGPLLTSLLPLLCTFPLLRHFCKDFQCWVFEKGLGQVSLAWSICMCLYSWTLLMPVSSQELQEEDWLSSRPAWTTMCEPVLKPQKQDSRTLSLMPIIPTQRVTGVSSWDF